MRKSPRTFFLSVLVLAYSLFWQAPQAVSQSTASGVPILVYHRFGPVVADSMTVTTARFEDQLAWLRAHAYTIIPLAALIDARRRSDEALPERAVVITADDGHKSVYTEMFPLIERYRFPVTLFIYPSAISNASYALTWDQLAEMRRSGFVDVQSHTFWHPNFDNERARLTPDAYRAFVMDQLKRSRTTLERRLGGHVYLLAWPFGIRNPELEQWATLAGYTAGFTLERRRANRDDGLMAMPRYLMTDNDHGARFAAIIEGADARRRP